MFNVGDKVKIKEDLSEMISYIYEEDLTLLKQKEHIVKVVNPSKRSVLLEDSIWAFDFNWLVKL